jgi:hypothetical protein
MIQRGSESYVKKSGVHREIEPLSADEVTV